MSRGINKVIILGRLGAEPEVRYMPNGSPVTSISVATSDSWTDRNTQEKQERTEWHKVVLFNKIGEIAAQYLRKGSRVFIEGSIRTSKWKDESGTDRYKTEIIANNMQLIDQKSDKEAEVKPASVSEARNYSAAKEDPRGYVSPVVVGNDSFDDDIPF